MHKLLFRIHMYAGLFCVGYMIIFGFSSLHFNHKFSFTTGPGKKTTWERPVKVGKIDDDRLYAQSVRDDLGLMGWTPPWQFLRDSQTGEFRFNIVRPGKSYRIELLQDGSLARVEETRLGFWRTFAGMHVVGQFPNSGFITRLWPIYTEICVWTILFAAASGVYFWHRGGKEKLIGWIMLAGGSGGSLALMLYVWLWG